MPTIDLTIASLRFNVYENHVSKPETRLAFVTSCVRDLIRDHYSALPRRYLIITGPEYMFARKNYTMSVYNTPEFKGLSVQKAAFLRPGAVKGEQVAVESDQDMEEGLEARRKVAYSEEEKDTILRELASLTTNQPNLLLIPGTIMWREYLYLKKMLKRLSPVSNTAPVLSNGEVVHLYNKKNPSDEIKVDYRLRGTAFGDQAERYRFVPGTASGKFVWKTLRCGIEICADHAGAILANELGPAQKLDLHVMVSAGMGPTKAGNCSKVGGLLITNDGSKQADSQQVNCTEPSGKLRPVTASETYDDRSIWRTQITI